MTSYDECFVSSYLGSEALPTTLGVIGVTFYSLIHPSSEQRSNETIDKEGDTITRTRSGLIFYEELVFFTRYQISVLSICWVSIDTGTSLLLITR